ncbi:MAG TPA: DUF2842 domain-containing protein, partial [Parvularculaceae bacterium]|nr:DUF2842 domain-containing protein [Parvularculaceae bacterium]
QETGEMAPRRKKLIALFILIPGLAAYAGAAGALGAMLPHQTLLLLAYYIAAGLAWIAPARFLLRWAEADPDRDRR